jgi:hypothetical protein
MGSILAQSRAMKIAYYCSQADHLKLGELSIASVRQHMPNAEIIHLTDDVTPALPGADTVLRFTATTNGVRENYWKRYWNAASHLTGETVLLGTDSIFRRDITSVFDGYFDVALPHIADKKWRYDAGTIFSRSPELYKRLAASPISNMSNAALFENDVVTFLAEFHRISATHQIVEISGEKYSFVPASANDAGIKKASIVHYRGPRKKWMTPQWQQPDGEKWN